MVRGSRKQVCHVVAASVLFAALALYDVVICGVSFNPDDTNCARAFAGCEISGCFPDVAIRPKSPWLLAEVSKEQVTFDEVENLAPPRSSSCIVSFVMFFTQAGWSNHQIIKNSSQILENRKGHIGGQIQVL